MSVSSLKREHRQLLRKRRRALERENFSFAARLGIKARKLKNQYTRLQKRQRGEFRAFMLDGHPGNITNACKRAIGHAYDHFNLRVSSTYRTPQHNAEIGGASGSLHTEDPCPVADLYGALSDMEAWQRRQFKRPSYWRELIGPINDKQVRDGETYALPEGDPLENLHDSHVHTAPRSSYR